jgi:hypothetical protein
VNSYSAPTKCKDASTLEDISVIEKSSPSSKNNNNKNQGPDAVANAYNPSLSGGGDWEDGGVRPAWKNKFVRLHLDKQAEHCGSHF